MMDLTFTIDWLSYTAHDEMIALPRLLVPYHPMRDFYPRKALFGYREAAENGAGALVMYTPENSKLGQHMIYSGGALNRYAAVAITWHDIIYHHNKRKDVCKRIDLAYDVRDSGLNIGALHDELQFNPDVAHARKFSRITSNDGGDTLYIGARTSEAMLRIYNKAAESHIDGDWKRIELELKGNKAITAVRMIADGGAESAPVLGKLWIAAVVEFHAAIWAQIVGKDGLPFGKAKKDKRDTEAWLLEQVAPAMGRFLARTPDQTVLDRFIKIVKACEVVAKTGHVDKPLTKI
jgi:hypothetical protein